MLRILFQQLGGYDLKDVMELKLKKSKKKIHLGKKTGIQMDKKKLILRKYNQKLLFFNSINTYKSFYMHVKNFLIN